MKHFAVLTLLASLLFTASCITQVVAPSSAAVTNQHYGLMGTMTADINCSETLIEIEVLIAVVEINTAWYMNTKIFMTTV